MADDKTTKMPEQPVTDTGPGKETPPEPEKTSIPPGGRKKWIYQCAESACPVFWKSPVRKEEIMVSDR